MTSAVEIATETEHAVLLILPLHPYRTSVDSSVTDKKTELVEAEVQDSAAKGSPSDALCGMSLLIIFLMIISGSVFAILYIVKHPGPPSPPSMHEQILGNVTQLLAEMSAYKELL